jgi:Na+-transporting NADH:ubiquinone oxidoreductase subunit NqrB
MANAKWVDGKATLPQVRPAQTITWVWADGRSGAVAVDVYAAAGASAITHMMASYRRRRV